VGLEALNVRERGRPRMAQPDRSPSRATHHCVQPRPPRLRAAAELAREKSGGIRISEHGVWRVSVRVGLNTRAKRLALIDRHRDPYERRPDVEPAARHINASVPGETIQIDRFFVDRLSGTKGSVWQYTAIDVASAYTSAELHTSERNPRARHTRELLRCVARELAQPGWKLCEATTDNGSESARQFRAAVDASAPGSASSEPGAPNSNGCVERVQLTILEECWRPSFARSLAPRITGLRQALDDYPDLQR